MNPKIITVFALLFTAVLAGEVKPPPVTPPAPGGYAPLPQQCGLPLVGDPCPKNKCCANTCIAGKCAVGGTPLDCCKQKKDLPPVCSLPVIGAPCDKDGKCCHGTCDQGKCGAGTTKPLDCCIPPPVPVY